MTFLVDLDYLRSAEFLERFYAGTRPGKWDCTDWARQVHRGYGQVQYPGRRQMLAHRIAWMIDRHEHIDPDLTVDHLCCNKICVNIDHLELVTARENSLRITRPAPGWVSVGNTEKWGLRRKRIGAHALIRTEQRTQYRAYLDGLRAA